MVNTTVDRLRKTRKFVEKRVQTRRKTVKKLAKRRRARIRRST